MHYRIILTDPGEQRTNVVTEAYAEGPADLALEFATERVPVPGAAPDYKLKLQVEGSENQWDTVAEREGTTANGTPEWL